MDVKLGETRYFDFDTVDPTTGLPAAPFALTINIYAGANNNSMAYHPGVSTRNTLGSYTVPVAFTAGNGFAVGTSYAVRAVVQFVNGGDFYYLSLGNAIVRAYSIDDVGAKTILIGTASGIVTSPASDTDDGPALTLRIRDDYTDTNGQPIEITLPSDYPDVTAVPITDIHLGFGPEFGDPELEVTATEIVQSGPAIVQIVKFSPRESTSTLLPPGDNWKATCLVDYGPGHRRSFNMTLTVERSYVA